MGLGVGDLYTIGKMANLAIFVPMTVPISHFHICSGLVARSLAPKLSIFVAISYMYKVPSAAS